MSNEKAPESERSTSGAASPNTAIADWPADAIKLDETVPVPGQGSGWIQWKGTEVCIDLHCRCGHQAHLDVGFLYFYRCSSCETTFAVGQTVRLYELTGKALDDVEEDGDRAKSEGEPDHRIEAGPAPRTDVPPIAEEASAGMWKRRAEALAAYVLGCDDAVAGGARHIVSGTGAGYYWPDEAPAIPAGYEVREFAPGDLRLVRLRDGVSFGMVEFPDLASAAAVGRALAEWAAWKWATGK